MDYFTSNEKVKEKFLRAERAVFLKKRQFLRIMFAVLFLIVQSFFYYSEANAVSAEDTVNVNALVSDEESTPLPDGGGGGTPVALDTTPPVISEVKIDSITEHSAKISWRTSEIAIPQINYGQSLELEKTYIGESFTSENAIFLENLSLQTLYYFEIVAIDRGGNRVFVKDLNFTTAGIPDNIPPANVSRFKAVSGNSEANLSWQNPLDADFSAVKIFRSEKFYPKGQKDGVLIYDGKESFFIDKNLVNGILYYYTAFAYDQIGNYSSGAIVKAMPGKYIPEVSPALTPPAPGGVEGTPKISPIQIPDLKLDDFIFVQDNIELKNINGKIDAVSGKSLIVSIDFNKVSETIGTMMFILAQDGEPESFLFKKDIGKNEYSVSFAVPAEDGIYSLTIAALGKNNDPLQALSGSLAVSAGEKTPEKSFWYVDLLWIFLAIFIILLLRVFWKIAKKIEGKNKQEDKEQKN